MERLYFSFLEKFSLFRRKGEKTGTRNGEKKECEEREQRSSSADKNQAREGTWIEWEERIGRQKNRKPRNRDMKKKRETEIIFIKNRRREKPHRNHVPAVKRKSRTKKGKRRFERMHKTAERSSKTIFALPVTIKSLNNNMLRLFDSLCGEKR